jgi:ubiquinone/menaquinone biosynthesis C-methylase UbiE
MHKQHRHGFFGNGHRSRLHGNRPAAFAGRSSRFYDVVARRLFRGVYRGLADDIAASAPHGAVVLDVGTGPGVLLTELAKRRPDLRLVGVDLSDDMVSAANRNLAPYADRASARVADVTDLPFADDEFDLVVSSISLHHWDEPEAAVGELDRVVRPGGQVWIYDFQFAPFDTLVSEAWNRSLFGGAPAQRTSIRTRPWFFPNYVKLTLTAASPSGQ